MTQHDRLGAALRGRAEDIGPGQDHPLTLGDVKGRARGIRRRRMAASGLAVAAVLAVVVPTGLTLTDGGSAIDSRPPVATTTPDAIRTPSATAAPQPGPAKQVLLTTDVEARGPEPGIPYLFDGGITMADGSRVPLTGSGYRSLAALGESLVVADDDRVRVVDRSGDVVLSAPGTGPLAVSQDGSVVAYSGLRGELMILTEGQDPLQVGESGTGAPVSPRAVLGSRDCHEASDGGCTVFFDVDGVQPAAMHVTSHGIRDRVAGLLRLGGLSPDRWVSGLQRVTDQGSCSVMLGSDWDVAWRTCDHTLGAFSPDGRYVLGHPAYRDGLGDASLAILDARTGNVLVEYANDASTQAYISTEVWDTDGTVLATVHEKGSWSLMRMTPDGLLGSVSGGGLAGGDESSPPLVLPARP